MDANDLNKRERQRVVRAAYRAKDALAWLVESGVIDTDAAIDETFEALHNAIDEYEDG